MNEQERRMAEEIKSVFKDDILFIKSIHAQVLTSLLEIAFNNIHLKKKSESERYSDLIVQKLLLHSHSIKKLSDGITFHFSKTQKEIHLYDPFSLNILVRSAMEAYLAYNFLVITPISEDERELRFNMWMYKGISDRPQSISNHPHIKSVIEADTKSKNELISKISTSPIIAHLSDKSRKLFYEFLKRDWKIYIKNSEIKKAGWRDLLLDAGISPGLGNDLYKVLSWHAHTESLSVLQLKDMYNEGEEVKHVCTSLRVSLYLLCFIINDIIHIKSISRVTFNNLPGTVRRMVIAMNLSIKPSYSEFQWSDVKED